MVRLHRPAPLALPLLLALGCGPADDASTADTAAGGADPARARLLARADSLELPGEWEPIPGEALVHHTGGFAKTLCSGVFVTGLDPADAAENVGYFTSPYEERAQVVDTVVDMGTQTVRLTLPSGVVRTAKRYGSQGCVAHSVGEDSVHFTPLAVRPALPDAATTPWPMGDAPSGEPWPADVDSAAVEGALDAILGPPGAMTEAVVVTRGNRVLGERYSEGIDRETPLESWSMGKSLTGTLMGVLIEQGAYELWQPAPVPEWREREDDPRQEIRIGDIMRMSSGLRIRAPQDPDYDPEMGYPDHLYLYTGPDAFHWAATRGQQWPPNTVGRYRNSDPVLTNYLIRLAVERRGEDYHAFPQRALFDRIGIRSAVLETDPQGNFLTQGYEFMSGRDWARLGNLWLRDGVWMGERILPEGYTGYARTLAPAWEADGRRVYGGSFLWLNLEESFPVPTDAFYMAGAGGQYTIVIPSRDVVVVRLGKYKGSRDGRRALERGLEMLMEAVPAVDGR